MIVKVILSENEHLRNKEINKKIKNKSDVIFLEHPNDYDFLINITEPPPYGSMYRTVVVYSLDGLSTTKSFLDKIQKKGDDRTICYFVLPKLKKNQLGEYLKTKPTVIIKAPKNKNDTKKYIKSLNYKLNNDVFDLFYSYVGNNPYYIDNELAKLAEYGDITEDVINTYCYNYNKINPFNQASKILTSKQSKFRIAYIAEYYQNSDDILGLINAFYYKLKQTIQYQVLEAEKTPNDLILEIIGINRWQQTEVKKITQIFDYKRLLKMLISLGRMKLKIDVNKLELLRLIGE